MNIETAMAEIVAADIAAKQNVAVQKTYHGGTWATAVVGLCLVAVAFGGAWLAYVEGDARFIADSAPVDKQTVTMIATVRVFKDFCPLNVPFKMGRVIEHYASKNPAVGKEEDNIRKDVASTAMLAGIARFMACPALQAQLDATAMQR